MHNGPKNPDDPAQWFTDSPAWDAFEAATGVTPEAFLDAFEDHIEEEASENDEDDEADDDDDEADGQYESLPED